MVFLITIGISISLDRSRSFALPPVRDWRPNPGPALRHPVHGATVAGRRAPVPPRNARHRRISLDVVHLEFETRRGRQWGKYPILSRACLCILPRRGHLERSQINPMKNQERIDSSPSKKITVLLVEDHLHCREALKHLLESSEDIKVIGEAKDGREAVRLTKSLLPEVVVMDISMPLLNGIEATRQIIENLPKSRVLILSAHSEAEYIEQAMMCGASGYLIKQSSTHMLAEAVREVGMGNSFFCSPVPKPVRDKCRKLFGKSKAPKRKAHHLAVSNNAS